MRSRHPAIAPELIACISEGRAPTVSELTGLARRIAKEVWGSRSAFTWGADTNDGSVHLISLRLAQSALVGECSDEQSGGPRGE